MILPGKRRSGEVTQVERLHLSGAGVPVFQAVAAGFDSQGTEIPIGEDAEGSLAETDDRHWSHIHRSNKPQSELPSRVR